MEDYYVRMAINNLVWPGDQLLCIHFCMHVCTVRVYVCVCVCVCVCMYVSARARYNLGPLALFFPLASTRSQRFPCHTYELIGAVSS